jgi:hypothetical protein
MYIVLTRAPAVHDVDVRWLKIYAGQYGRDEEFTQLSREARDNPIAGPPVKLSDLRRTGFHDDLTFFQCTLFKSIVQIKGTHWDTSDRRRSQLRTKLTTASFWSGAANPAISTVAACSSCRSVAE